MPKLRIEEAACSRRSIAVNDVGVNKYQLDKEPDVDVLDIDNSAVRAGQIERKKFASSGITRPVELAGPFNSHQKRRGQPVGAGGGCSRSRGNCGEISQALEEQWGRHAP